jgi:hypothetical protein
MSRNETYRSLVVTAALVFAAFGAGATRADAASEQPNASEPCASLVQTLRTDINSLKQLLTQRGSALDGFARPKKSTNANRLTHGKEIDQHFSASTDTAAETRRAAARQREQVEALNGMLPGFGCHALDIEAELRK